MALKTPLRPPVERAVKKAEEAKSMEPGKGELFGALPLTRLGTKVRIDKMNALLSAHGDFIRTLEKYASTLKEGKKEEALRELENDLNQLGGDALIALGFPTGMGLVMALFGATVQQALPFGIVCV